eukprot:jgi/Chlat1/8495/Chrsp80S07934
MQHSGCILSLMDGELVLTSGADCHVRVHNASTLEETTSQSDAHDAISSLSISPKGDAFATASVDRTVRLYSLPDGDFLTNVTRFTLPARCIAYSPSASVLAAAGDDDGVKLISMGDFSVVRVLRGLNAYVRAIAYDPRSDYVAAAGDDGTVAVCPNVKGNDLSLNKIAWHPDGTWLAVPSVSGNGVVAYERSTWKPAFCLEGTHTAPVSLLAWSPNGLYLATAGADKHVVLWDVAERRELECHKQDCLVTGMAWHPSRNALALADQEGKYGVWEGAVPALLTPPAAPTNAKDKEAERRLYEFEEEEEEEKEEEGGEKRGGISDREDGDACDSGAAASNDGNDEDDGYDNFKARPRNGKAKDKAFNSKARTRLPPTARPLPQRQPAFQPGSTPPDASRRRFLAFTLVGTISAREDEGGRSTIEVEFHDTMRGARIPAMTNHYGFGVAALGENGAAYASREPATLFYRPFNAWASNSDWTRTFAGSENVEAVAVGKRWVAAATSERFLRVFSESGVQRFILSLPGPVVALAGHDHLLAAVWHASPPSYDGDQMLEFAVYSVGTEGEQAKVAGGALPLSPAATLTWLGFSESGALATSDSKGVLRVHSPQYDGCWVPVFSSAADRQNESESHWVVGVSDTEVVCVVCKGPSAHPSVHPRPVLSELKLAVPVLESDVGAAPTDLEEEYLRGTMTLARMRTQQEDEGGEGGGGGGSEDSLLDQEAQMDRCLLRMIAAACKGDRLMRALEMAHMLALHKSLEGAVRIATAMRLPALAERLNLLLEARMQAEEEAEQAAMAAAAAAASAQAEPNKPSFCTNAAATASPSAFVTPAPVKKVTFATPTPAQPPGPASNSRHAFVAGGDDEKEEDVEEIVCDRREEAQPTVKTAIRDWDDDEVEPVTPSTTKSVSRKKPNNRQQETEQQQEKCKQATTTNNALPQQQQSHKSTNPFLKAREAGVSNSGAKCPPANPFARRVEAAAPESAGKTSGIFGSVSKMQSGSGSVSNVAAKRKGTAGGVSDRGVGKSARTR